MNAEHWKAIAGFEGRYEVSDHGHVRSVARSVPSPRHGPGATREIRSRILATQVRSGYLTISLRDEEGSTGKQVHRLVAEAFLLNPMNYAEVNHLDTDRMNARLDNLEWCDRSYNVAYSYKIGKRPSGAAHHFARLPRDERGHCIGEHS